MAPVEMQVLGWAAVRSLSPELILASLLALIALVKVLTNCTDCNRDKHGSSHRERSPSTIRVVQMEEAAMSRENPAFEYMSKDEQVRRPAPEKGSVHLSVTSGDVWYTPWKSHNRTLNQQDHLANVLYEEQKPANSISLSPANNSPGSPRPSGVAVIPHREEANALPSSHPENTQMENVQPRQQSGTREVNDGFPDSSTHALHQQWLKAQHTYESLKEMEDAVTEETDSSGYQTVEELNGSTPSPSDHMQEAGSSASTTVEGQEEGEMGLEINNMYAQVSKKHQRPTQPPTERREPVSLPQQPMKEEEGGDPAPPVPYRSFEI